MILPVATAATDQTEYDSKIIYLCIKEGSVRKEEEEEDEDKPCH